MDGGPRMGSMTVVTWRRRGSTDVWSSHQDVDVPHVHQLLYEDLHAGIQQRKKQKLLLIIIYLLFVSIQIFETWKKSNKLRPLVALCSICWRAWVLGLELPKVNFTFQIWRMFRRSRRRPREEWRDRDCTDSVPVGYAVCSTGNWRPGWFCLNDVSSWIQRSTSSSIPT